MTKPESWINYEERLARVTGYMHAHLEDDIDLARLAEIACLSPYHWHRIYRAVHGETIAATVRRLRLHHAAGRLANSAMSLDEIARRAGYGSLAAFTRAFSASYGMPPAQFRKSGDHSKFEMSKETPSMTDYPVEIKDLPARRLATLPHTGSYMEISRTCQALCTMIATRNWTGPEMRLICVYYDDPEIVPEAELRSRAGVVVDEGFIMEPPLEEVRLAAGPHAVLMHRGPYSSLGAAHQWLYGQWLVNSDREPADAPPFEDYRNSPRDTPPSELLTEICLPLR